MTQQLDDRVEALLGWFRKIVVEKKIMITADERVNERDAAFLIGQKPETLHKLRSAGGPRFYRLGIGMAKVSYRLRDLAIYVEQKAGAADKISDASGAFGGVRRAGAGQRAGTTMRKEPAK